jgi:hypothetical protein
MSALSDPIYKGLQEAINFRDKPQGTEKDVNEDLEEQSLEMGMHAGREEEDLDKEEVEGDEGPLGDWKDVLARASRGVTDGTAKEYIK